MVATSVLGNYEVKKCVLDVKYVPSFEIDRLHGSALEEIRDGLTALERRTEKGFVEYRLTYAKDFRLVVSELGRLLIAVENGADNDQVIANLKFPLRALQKLKAGNVERAALRTFFVFPFDGTFNDLVLFCRKSLIATHKAFDSFGPINDVGLVALVVSEGALRYNIGIGPYSRSEIRDKISDFKDYKASYENGLVFDIEVSASSQVGKIETFLEQGFNSCRIKMLQFIDRINI